MEYLRLTRCSSVHVSSAYKPIGTGVRPFAEAGGGAFKPLFNGNIGAMSVNLPKVGEPLQYNYRYDALNRRNGNNTWAGKSLEMDRLKYYYVSGTNKLDHIVDSTDASAYTEDLDTQDENYSYDAIGNLVKDQGSNIDEIKWTVYGKISDIHKTTDNGTTIHYTYDAGGNRISKTVNGVVTWYVRDATGNVMSIYTRGDNNVNGGHLTQTETDIYGSSRLGVEEHKVDLDQQPAAVPGGDGGTDSGFMFDMPRGEKVYELGNHLGNVLATVEDVKVPESTDNAIVSEYDPRVRSAQDYYPFGMQEPGRVFSDASYRYGFNGMEGAEAVNDDKLDFGKRIFDTKTGRWFSLDPKQKKYAGESNYIFTGNNPILYMDPDGEDKIVRITIINSDGKGVVYRMVDKNFITRYSRDNASDGIGYFNREDLVRDVTIDNRSGSAVLTATEGWQKSKTTFWDYTTGIIGRKLGDLDKSLSSSESDKVQYGYQIYAGATAADSWTDALPKGLPGSESIDIKAMLDFVGGLREGMAPTDLLEDGPLKEALELIDKRKEALSKSYDALDAIITPLVDKAEAKGQMRAGSDSCAYCHHVESKDSMNNHIDPAKNHHQGPIQKTKVEHRTDDDGVIVN